MSTEKDERAARDRPAEIVDAAKRDLVRKAAYTAPALVALSFATSSAQAQPPSAPAFMARPGDRGPERDGGPNEGGRQP